LTGIRSLIFDMDGVIIDSNPWHRVAWTEYNRKLGIETTEAMQQTMYGKRNDELIREFFGPDLSDGEVFAHGAAKEALYRDLMKPVLDCSLVPGIRQFLTRHHNLDLAIATNAEPANVDFVLDGAGIRSLFRVVVNGHDVSRPKPDPEIYLRVAQLLETEPASCIVFEDSRAGVEAGVAAGMTVVGVSTTHDDLKGVALSIPDFNDPALEAWLQARL
jgi:beta-phosphoglucomutase family hydrolase